MRILIVRLSALGDVVCTLPVASALRETYPESEIVWIADRRFAGIAECCSAINQVVVAPRGVAESRDLMSRLGRFDLALDMQGLLKSGILVGAADAEEKLGYHWQREGSWLFSSRVKPDPTSIHIVDQYVDVARAAGANTDHAVFGLFPREEDLVAVRSKLSSARVDSARPIVILNAGAGWSTKRWPAAHFGSLATALTNAGAQPVFIGTDADRMAFEEVRAHSEHAIDFLGQTSVRELVALCSLAELHVAGDTGSTHLAAALGKPCIGLYTLTRPERSCPYGQLHHSKELEPEKVIRMAMKLLNQKVPA